MDYKMDDNRDGHVYLSEENKILFGHFCKTKFVGAINNRLSVQQKHYIEGTPCWWFPMLTDSVKSSRKLLSLLVDDIDNIGKYNWGTLVYEYLVSSLCIASLGLKNESAAKHFDVVGCVYLFQFMEVACMENTLSCFY
ncbi:hypothetical protein DEO72_LG6g636 [Vigna unguiculata]|uniref:Aminotransferase-like n=1 Tax=Vigna unguiculata TaxID=3917 RepID=A0A4D6M5Y0_VIGUN|nr:hypothetical protein DEO72_LG6g636 [Vigna unguiculata]